MKIIFALLLLTLVLSCSDGDIKPGLPAVREIEVAPVLHLSFDHPPTFKEIKAAITAKNPTGSLSDISPGPWVGTIEAADEPREKNVILSIKTSNITNAGTDNAGKCRFIGTWLTNNNVYSTVSFILNNDDVDDLNRNAYDLFLYLYKFNYDSDTFISGQLKNTGSDGWLCEYVDFMDVSCGYTDFTRQSILTWGTSNDWVQSDGNTLSPKRYSTVSTVLDYSSCD